MEDAEFWGIPVRCAGKWVPRCADLDQASSGEPEPPEEVARATGKGRIGRMGGESVTVVVRWVVGGLVVGL